MHARTPVASAFVAVFAAPLASAQQAPARLEPVVVTGAQDRESLATPSSDISKLPADLRDVPQSVTIVNKALMNSQGAVSIADALRNVPGITLGGAEGGQIGNNINLNGFTVRTDIYLDGARDRGQYYRDVFAMDAIEVLMGPSSMLFGRGSTGGIVNQVTKKPSLKQATEITGSVTTNGLVRATVDHNQPVSDTSAWRIAAMAQDGSPSTRDEMKNHDWGLAPSFRSGIGEPTEITLSALLQHNRDQPDYGIGPLNGHPAPVDRDSYYGYDDDRTAQDLTALSATVKHKATPTVTVRNQTQYNHVRTDALETAPNTIGTVGGAGFAPLVPAATSALPVGQLYERLQSHDRVIHDSTLSNQTEVNAKITQGSMRHDLLGGLELGHDEYTNQNRSRTGLCNGVALPTGFISCVPLDAPPGGDAPATTTTPGNRVSARANSVGLYGNDTFELTPQFKLVGGLRWDRFSARISNSAPTATTPAKVSQLVTYTSTRLGALWQPTGTQSYYASYSTSFNPTLEQLTETTGATQPLPPQENHAYELGGKWDLAGGTLSMNAALFQITQFNARSQNTDGTYSATGTIRVNGARLGAAGRINPQWQVFGGYSYLDAKIIDGIAIGTSGMVPWNTPKHTGSLWALYAFLPHWEAGAGFIAMSERFANNTDTTQVGGYTRYDASIAYKQPSYDIRLNVFNLTDKHYFDALIQSDGGRSVPGIGRTAMLSFTYRL